MQGKMESFNVFNQGYGRKWTLFWKISLVAVKMWEQGRLEAGQLGHICAEHLLFVSTDLPYNLTCSLRLNWLWITSTVFQYPLASVGFDQHSLGDQRERLRVIIHLDSFLQGLCALTKVLLPLSAYSLWFFLCWVLLTFYCPHPLITALMLSACIPAILSFLNPVCLFEAPDHQCQTNFFRLNHSLYFLLSLCFSAFCRFFSFLPSQPLI